jgi:hypothetical protein
MGFNDVAELRTPTIPIGDKQIVFSTHVEELVATQNHL